MQQRNYVPLGPHPTSLYSRSRNSTPSSSATRRQAAMSIPGSATALAVTSEMCFFASRRKSFTARYSRVLAEAGAAPVLVGVGVRGVEGDRDGVDQPGELGQDVAAVDQVGLAVGVDAHLHPLAPSARRRSP